MATPKNPLEAWRQLYRGDSDYQFIQHRKWWYLASILLAVLSIAGILMFKFNFGIEFVGGNQFQASVEQGVELPDLEEAVTDTGVEVATGQVAGSGDSARYLVRTADLSASDTASVRQAIAETLEISSDDVAVSEVSPSWGESVGNQAIVALVVFLLLVCGYLWVRYDRAMAGASIIGLVHNLVFTAGVYAVVGFEVTPNTVIGILTIMGYALYDNVVVFDKVYENTRDTLKQRKYTYGEGTNRAINQTLMRSFNTSLIGLLPVAGLLFVGAGILGVGTLTDLSLVLFVGIATGTFSSLFFSSPLLVDITMLQPQYREHSRRVLAKRREVAGNVDEADDVEEASTRDSDDDDTADAFEVEVVSADDESPTRPKAMSAAGGKPGNRPANKRSSGGKKKKRR